MEPKQKATTSPGVGEDEMGKLFKLRNILDSRTTIQEGFFCSEFMLKMSVFSVAVAVFREVLAETWRLVGSY